MCALAGRFKEHFGRDVPQLDWTKRMQLALDAAAADAAGDAMLLTALPR